ncbi:hypothetical protein M0R89_05975 [Halorussus limi]|uniref:Uncharacterized protein n=1 Tax=Halorussus limi TaxID=2938695 RepID=A0A8U0HXP9_9EURY|nr:hypothetical protein [Halorussus limi]UPV75609.1 hypothetical protein M0R89_05975 [Halorussus limi]
MSTETPERAHDPERLPEGERADGSNPRPDDDLRVVVCPQRVYEQLRPELDERHERRCGDYEREYEELLTERARLADEVNRLERRLESKKSQLDAVVTRNERVLEARTESYRERIAGDGDDFEWTGRRQESGLLARLKAWIR